MPQSIPDIALLGEKSALLIPKSWQSQMHKSGVNDPLDISISQNLEICHNLTNPVESPVTTIFESDDIQITEIVSS